jgi:hypothetical protein
MVPRKVITPTANAPKSSRPEVSLDTAL